MFQIAATIGYAKKYDVPFIFPTWTHQNEFEMPANFFQTKVTWKSHYQEPSFTYKEIPFQPDCALYGYFQSWKYFEHCQDYIAEIFTPKDAEDPRLFRNLCCIHVRRGDYLKFPDYHPLQSIDYYKKAMELIPARKYIIFSDDVKWCESNFIGDQYVVTEAASSAIDFKIMMACNHFILANSSFSWWAAWLSPHDDKVVVVPENWFGSKIKETNPTHDLIPYNWIRI